MSRKQDEGGKAVLGEDNRYTLDGEKQVSCFGVFWEANVAGEDGEQCRGCGVKDPCFIAFVEDRLAPRVEPDGTADVKALSKEFEVGVQAIQKGIERVNLTRIQSGQLSESSGEEEVKTKKTPLKKVAKKARTKKAPATKKRAKKAPAKKRAKKRPPPQAGGRVSRATAPASTRKRTTGAVKSVAALAGSREFGEHTWEARWMRERKRHKVVGNLRPGQKLEVVRRLGSGEPQKFRATVRQGYYVAADGTKHPTLYKLTEYVSGKCSVWSGPRFWKLV